MSQLNVDTIKKADGTGNLTVPAETGTVVTTASPSLGRRNLIINGAMQVAQRGASETGLTNSTGGGYKTVDRFGIGVDTAIGTFSVSQSTDAPDGFGNSFKLEMTTANASNDAGDLLFFQQSFEGQNLQQLNKGTASAESFILSFWVKSSLTGTFTAEFRDYDNSRHIGQEYIVNSANTWERKTLTFSGDTTGVFDNDNARSLMLLFWLHAGSRWNGGSLATSWATLTDGNRASPNQVALCDTNGATWQITGVQLEVGDTATPFEHRSYGEELALCQRYYQIIQAPRVNSVGICIALAVSSVLVELPLSVTPRELTANDRGSGTLTKTGTVTVNGFPSNGDNISSIAYWHAYQNMLSIALNHSLTLTQYSAYPIRYGASDGQIVFTLDTEL